MKRQKRTVSHVSKLEKNLPIKNLRLSEDIHSDIKRFAARAGRTMVQQIRQYIIDAVAQEREGIPSMGQLEELVKKVAKENEEIKAQLQELLKVMAEKSPAPKTPPENN
jgi:predicted Fe-Mo cluster-binding NifX family protein